MTVARPGHVTGWPPEFQPGAPYFARAKQYIALSKQR